MRWSRQQQAGELETRSLRPEISNCCVFRVRAVAAVQEAQCVLIDRLILPCVGTGRDVLDGNCKLEGQHEERRAQPTLPDIPAGEDLPA